MKPLNPNARLILQILNTSDPVPMGMGDIEYCMTTFFNTHIARQTMYWHLDRLLEHGFIAWPLNKTNSRRQQRAITITKTGRKALQENGQS